MLTAEASSGKINGYESGGRSSAVGRPNPPTPSMMPLGASFLRLFSLLKDLLLWSSSVLVTGVNSGGDGAWWTDWAVVAQIVLTSTTLMVLLLYKIATSTVLYMYCKVVHGELALEITREYVSFPFADGKAPHVWGQIVTWSKLICQRFDSKRCKEKAPPSVGRHCCNRRLHHRRFPCRCLRT